MLQFARLINIQKIKSQSSLQREKLRHMHAEAAKAVAGTQPSSPCCGGVYYVADIVRLKASNG